MTTLGLALQAAILFAVTNVDDLVMLALFFAQGAGRDGATARIAVGQYLGFVGILAIAVAAAYGATFLPESSIHYLGLIPLTLGLNAAWQTWRHRRSADDGVRRGGGPTTWSVAAVTFANGGDNVGVYVPVFATSGATRTALYVVVFLVLLAGLLVAGRYLATRPAIASLLSRWGHVLLPVVLIVVGVAILLGG
ncbi:hypothetical protein MMAD_38070 [Mycolicibacterium madagascariense]|uniref:Cadmium transporter n=1 Tax=Mycolicibacterium madagascariense TaxID=212765 RepID=A0A7I7XK18_9MYCO|nr:cadmium resistance transporter [Mycolicibacterium madagascariense]MCV7010837.1 cadmium resistance transporter [Mycolicibacterium madagascariense]BBZ29512.1 hypothetical protein MMAD_38070 [Mycolicibacterium madagascariense]